MQWGEDAGEVPLQRSIQARAEKVGRDYYRRPLGVEGFSQERWVDRVHWRKERGERQGLVVKVDQLLPNILVLLIQTETQMIDP